MRGPSLLGVRWATAAFLLALGPTLVPAPAIAAGSANNVSGSISISPATSSTEVGTTRVLTITMAAVGSTIAPGTYSATANLSNSGGSVATFVGSSTCSYTDVNPSCTVTISSQSAGGSRVTATTSFMTTSGTFIARHTGSTDNAAAGGSDPASVLWVQATAALNPVGVVAAVGTSSAITATAGVLGAPMDAGGTFQASISGGPGGFSGPSSCDYAASASTSSCTLALTSSQAGTTAVHATTAVSLGGIQLTRSADYSETWVDGKIDVSAPSAFANVGGQQVVTITVTPLGGTLDPGTYTANVSITKPGTFVGGSSCTYTNVQPSCTVTVNASAAGTATINASSSFRVSGIAIKRVTGTPENAAAGGSDHAGITWSIGGGSGSSGTPALSVSLSPRSQTISPGGTARFTVTVTNTGDVYLSGVSVTDVAAPHCSKATGDVGAFNALAPGASTGFRCSLGAVSSSLTNTVTASAQGPHGESLSASDSVPVTVAQPAATTTAAPAPAPPPPATTTPKTAKLTVTLTPAAQTVLTRITTGKKPAGGTLTVVQHGTARFTIRVRNTGNVALSSVILRDPTVLSCAQKLGRLAVGMTKTITCTRLAVLKPFTHVVSVTAKALGRTLQVTSARVHVRVAIRRQAPLHR
jgi:hypothetical protein